MFQSTRRPICCKPGPRPRTCRDCPNPVPIRKQLCAGCADQARAKHLARVKQNAKVWKREQRRRGRRSENHRSRARRYGVDYDPQVTRPRVLDRDGWTCAICCKPIPNIVYIPEMSDEYGTIDHVIPLSMGGGHVWSNVRAAHNRCNWEAFATQAA